MTRCLNRLDFAERMLSLFHDQFGEELSELEQAFDDGNLVSVGKIAHRLQGACANAAATGLQSRAAELRNAVNKGSRDETSQRLSDLQSEWQRFSTAMKPDGNLANNSN
jgi:HPt (histidine-containing phosphotransfer) domain-containing protein